jgi:hypothetical protein
MSIILYQKKKNEYNHLDSMIDKGLKNLNQMVRLEFNPSRRKFT